MISCPRINESSGDYISPSSVRVVLVERCHSSLEWEEAPEDLALSLTQLSSLRRAAASVCGVQGVQETAVLLVRIVSTGIASKIGSACSSDNNEGRCDSERGRGVEDLIRHHVEACARSLLLLSTTQGCPSSSSAVTVMDEEEAAVVLSILQSGLLAGKKAGGEQSRSMEANAFMWRMFRACCASFSRRSVQNTLKKLCGSGPKSNALQILLTGASDNWYKDRESRNTTLFLLSWCIFIVQDGSTFPPLTSSLLSGDDVAETGSKDPGHGKDLISCSLAALDVAERKSLSLAVELLASQLTAKERGALKHVF